MGCKASEPLRWSLAQDSVIPMQLPSVDRTVNGPAPAADSQTAAGGAAPAGMPAPRATREETRALQDSGASGQPEPSMRVELSAQADALIRSGRVQAENEAAALAGAVFVTAAVAVPGLPATEAAQAGLLPGVQGVGATSASPAAGASTDAVETPQTQAYVQATGEQPGPERPSGPTEAAPKDWTEKPKAEEEKPPEPPKEPISKKLLEFLQSLWRAGGNAIDVAQTGNLLLNPPKEADSPVVYEDPSTTSSKKTPGV